MHSPSVADLLQCPAESEPAEDAMSDSNVVNLFEPRRLKQREAKQVTKLPAPVQPKDPEKEEEGTIKLIVESLLYHATMLLNSEGEEALKALPKNLRRQKIMYRARELAKAADKVLEKKIFTELLGSDDPHFPHTKGDDG